MSAIKPVRQSVAATHKVKIDAEYSINRET